MEHGMSIAIVTETYPPELNGVALTVERAVHHLRERGHRVSVVRPRQGADQGHEDAMLVRGLPLPRYPGLQFGLPAPLRLLQRWREVRPDVVHIVTEGPLGWSALVAARQLDIPVTTDYRTHFQKYSGYYRLGPLAGIIAAALRAFHNHSDVTFVPTRALADEMTQRGYRKLACVGRGVDTQLFSPLRRSRQLRVAWGVGDEHLVVLHVGRLAPEKDPALVRAAFRAIRELRPDARLVWVGDGPLRANLQRADEGEADSGERFVGIQRGEDLAMHYASADLFLFPSLSETFGNVVLEAMASALPIVAYDIGAAGEHLKDRAAASVVSTADGPSAFIAAARALALLDDTRRLFGANARDIALELAWPLILGRFEAQLVQFATRHSSIAHVATAA
ncbi:glycosyltransferase family 1 protein [Azoarcus sp. KH32C]|uniref:glycosyltransferase family 4 protein n=1 Tax=Azoarcus sp. KH32C TaxID=748247 RepID=UPI0002386DBD|nr:glycosyltransferase family 1 protein [Azoarcus sp. KH32C]BAL24945.1 glycosyltransferase family protein [Azoarcus sp. KH32C]